MKEIRLREAEAMQEKRTLDGKRWTVGVQQVSQHGLKVTSPQGEEISTAEIHVFLFPGITKSATGTAVGGGALAVVPTVVPNVGYVREKCLKIPLAGPR